MMTDTKSLLLVGRPGRMREGLHALLRTIPEIEILGQVDSGLLALALVSQQQPAIVLLDSSLTLRETLQTIMQIKVGHPQTRCIVLVDNLRQQSAARVSGADTALIMGFTAEVLHAAIDQVRISISNSIQSGEDGPHD